MVMVVLAVSNVDCGEWCWWWVVLNGELREEEDGDVDMA